MVFWYWLYPFLSPYLHNLMRLLLLHLAILSKQVLDVNQTNTIIEYVDRGQKLVESHCQEKSRRRVVTPLTPACITCQEGLNSHQQTVNTNKVTICIDFLIELLEWRWYFEISLFFFYALSQLCQTSCMTGKNTEPKAWVASLSRNHTEICTSYLLLHRVNLKILFWNMVFTFIQMLILRIICWLEGELLVVCDGV